MANASIPGLPVAITLDGTEQMELVQPPGSGGTTKRGTVQQISNTAQIGIIDQGIAGLVDIGVPNATLDFMAILHTDGKVYKVSPAELSQAQGNVPAGGTASQLLIKASSTSYDVIWATMTGDISVSGTTAFSAIIAPNVVTYDKMQQAPGLAVFANSSSVAGNVTSVPGTANQVLIINPAGTGLLFGQVNLSSTSAVTGFLSTGLFTGILAVPFGGSGTGSLTTNGLVAGNGTASVKIIPADVGGKLLIAQGTASIPAFETIAGDISFTAAGTATIGNGAVTYAKLQQVAALSVVGNSSSATATAVAISGTANQVLQINQAGTGVIFAAVNATASLTGIVPVALGGTGTAALVSNAVLLGSGTAAVTFASVASATAGFVLASSGTGSAPTFSKVNLSSTLVTGILTVPFGGIGTTALTVSALLYGNGTNAVQTVGPGTANQVVVMNNTGTAVVFGQVNLTAGVTGVLPLANGGTNATSAANAIVNLSGLALNTTGQAFTGGVTLAALNLGTTAGSTLTLVAGNPPLQRVAWNGTGTIVAPSSDCEIDLMITNAASAGAMSFSGYNVGSNTGDTYTTTSGSRFILISVTVNGSSTYSYKALQ